MQGFKEFIMRGNLIELAVAFIMGTAFNSVVESFTQIILSLISAILGGPADFSAFQPAGLPVGAFLTQLFSFLLVASVVYFGLVLPTNKIKERMSQNEAEDEPTVTEADLLAEIRDLLAAGNKG